MKRQFLLRVVFQVVYFYNIFDSLRKIKQRAWQENRQVTDGYSFGKKILVLLPFLILIILGVMSAVFAGKFVKDTPEKVIQKSVIASSDLKAVSFNILYNVKNIKINNVEKNLSDLPVDVPIEMLKKNFNIELNVIGQIDAINEDDIKSEINLNLDLGSEIGILGAKSLFFES